MEMRMMSSIEEKKRYETEEITEPDARNKIVKKIAWYTHRRDYLRLCRGMRILVREHDWKETVSFWKEVPVWSKGETHKWAHDVRPSQDGVLPIRRGKIRDGLLRVLGLEGVAGIDIDLLRTFGRIRANEFQSLREKAIPIALKHLKRQINRGPTFYLDTEKMVGTGLEKLVPAILKRREKEFLTLGACTTYSKLAGTYYGFMNYTDAITKADLKAVKRLDNVPIRVHGQRPSYRRIMFKNCSDDQTDLLLNSLRVAVAVPIALNKGAVALGIRGDSRAVGPLKIGLKRAHQSWQASGALEAWCKLSWALSEIGSPISACSDK